MRATVFTQCMWRLLEELGRRVAAFSHNIIVADFEEALHGALENESGIAIHGSFLNWSHVY